MTRAVDRTVTAILCYLPVAVTLQRLRATANNHRLPQCNAMPCNATPCTAMQRNRRYVARHCAAALQQSRANAMPTMRCSHVLRLLDDALLWCKHATYRCSATMPQWRWAGGLARLCVCLLVGRRMPRAESVQRQTHKHASKPRHGRRAWLAYKRWWYDSTPLIISCRSKPAAAARSTPAASTLTDSTEGDSAG